MTVNLIMLLVSLCVGGLGGYGFWAANFSDKFGLLVSIVAGVMIFVLLAGLIALKSKNPNGSVGNIRALSATMLIISLITNIVFSFFNFQKPAAYIIVNGIEFLIFILVSYAVYSSLKGESKNSSE